MPSQRLGQTRLAIDWGGLSLLQLCTQKNQQILALHNFGTLDLSGITALSRQAYSSLLSTRREKDPPSPSLPLTQHELVCPSRFGQEPSPTEWRREREREKKGPC